MRNATTSMAEYRLFCVYLAHFNMNDANDDTVTFKLSDYAKIVELKRPRKEDLEAQAQNIVSTTLQINNPETGEFEVYSVFKKFKLHHEVDGWYVTLKGNDELSPHLREQSKKFIRYKLYNTIFLKSFNQQRIYELLKQYEKIGERTIALEELRAYLSIGDEEYPVWGVFARDVLKVAQKALKENTDISFEYEGIKRGRPVVAVKFTIKPNGAYKDRLKIGGFLPTPESSEDYNGEEITANAPEQQEEREEEYEQTSLFDDIDPLAHERDLREEICEGFQFEFFDEFSLDQLREFYELSKEHIDKTKVTDLRKEYGTGELGYKQAMDTVIFEYVKKKILYVKSQGADRSTIGYIRKAIAEDYR